MKTITFPTYGSPDGLELRELDIPTPTADEVQVNIHTAALNPLDWRKMRADPFFVRASEGIFRPKNPTLGADIAGTVTAVGANVTTFKVGDRVFGDVSTGGLAEYTCAKPDHITLLPEGVSFAQAAATPVAALTALQGLVEHGNLQAGHSVLINGASGGIGTYAIQIAKALGATVTAVCSFRNIELVQSLGADHVIDYTKTDFTTQSTQYDVILDNVNNYKANQLHPVLKPGGTCVVAGFKTVGSLLNIALSTNRIQRKHNKTVMTMMAKVKQADLITIGEMLADGRLKSVIDRTYPLADTAEGMHYLETGRARGKVLVEIATA